MVLFPVKISSETTNELASLQKNAYSVYLTDCRAKKITPIEFHKWKMPCNFDIQIPALLVNA